MAELNGIDVSKWQGAIDWRAAGPSVSFVFVKATQGVAEVDARYAENIAALRAGHKLRGSYHYADGGDAAAEAEYYVRHAARQTGELQVLDFEGAALGLTDPVGWAHDWLARVIALTDNVPLIYMSASTVTRFDWARVVGLNVGLWAAAWGSEQPGSGQWPFVIAWQTSNRGRVAGIAGDVDTDTFFGDASVWQRYGASRTPATHQPAPPSPAPRPAPHPPAPHPTSLPLHTVVAGDTLSALASSHHTTVAHLVELNRGRYPSLATNPNHIEVGWTLRLDASTPAPQRPEPVAHRTHRIVPGDTLGALAKANHTSVQQLVDWNAGVWAAHGQPVNPDHIEVGWLLRVA